MKNIHRSKLHKLLPLKGPRTPRKSWKQVSAPSGAGEMAWKGPRRQRPSPDSLKLWQPGRELQCSPHWLWYIIYLWWTLGIWLAHKAHPHLWCRGCGLQSLELVCGYNLVNILSPVHDRSYYECYKHKQSKKIHCPATHNIIRIRYVLLLLNVWSPCCRYVISLTAVTATNWILTVNIPKQGTLYCYWTGEEWIWKCEPLLCYHPGINIKLKVHIFPFNTLSCVPFWRHTNQHCTLSRLDRSQTNRS